MRCVLIYQVEELVRDGKELRCADEGWLQGESQQEKRSAKGETCHFKAKHTQLVGAPGRT